MSAHSIKCSYDSLLLYEIRLCSLKWPGMAIYIWRLYTLSAAWVLLRHWRGFWNFFLHLYQSVHDKKRPVLKPILTVEIEIIHWCLTNALQILSYDSWYFPNYGLLFFYIIVLRFNRFMSSKEEFRSNCLYMWDELSKWKCKFRKLLSSHALLSSFLLRSNQTTLQAQVCRVFNHANWPTFSLIMSNWPAFSLIMF